MNDSVQIIKFTEEIIIREACKESEMDYSRLLLKDKQVILDYLAHFSQPPYSDEVMAQVGQKTYLVVLQDRLRRLDEWRKVLTK
jgi:hypothetical protein